MLCASVVGCSDDGGTDDDDDDDNTITATIDGVAYSATLAVQGTYSGGALVIGGTTSNQRGINIAIPQISQPGTFDVGPGSTAVVTHNIGGTAWVTSLAGGTGTVTVTALSATRAAGTFAVTAVGANGAAGNKVITNGQFDVTF